MNGRIYDPTLGRFLQADPFIQASNYSQSYNRYSYIMNNPLSGTDPSGYISLSKVFSPLLRPLIKLSSKIIGPELTNVIGNILFYKIGGPLGSAYWTYNFTRAHGGSQSGALRGAFTAAASAFALQGIGGSEYWGQAGSPQNIFANAMVGGVAAELQGGKFGHGFLSAGFTSAFKPLVNQIGGGSAEYMPVRVITAAVIGGTASKLSGGKFANGATTGAFVQLFNAETRLAEERDAIEKSINAAMHDVADIDRNTPEGRARLAAYLVLDGQAANLDDAYKMLSSGSRAFQLHARLNIKLANMNYKNAVKAFTALAVGNVEDAKNFKFGLDVSAAASGSIRLQGATFILDMKSIVDAANLGGQLTADHGVIGLADEGQAYLMNKYGK